MHFLGVPLHDLPARPFTSLPFRLKNGRLIGWLALLGSLGLFFLYLPGSPSALVWPVEWGIFLAWFILGALIYLPRAKSHHEGSDSQA